MFFAAHLAFPLVIYIPHQKPLIYSRSQQATVHNMYFFFFGGGFFNFYFYFILLYNTVLVLPYIDMKPPRVYMHSET